MSRCRCLYIAPNHNAKSIKIDENQDILINTDVPNWSDYQHLQPHIIHYTGSNPDIMLLVQKLGAACLRWQPSAAVMLEVSGLKRINLQLALNEPFVLRCDDASFAEIHLAHGCDYFAPTFGQGLPHMVLKADARTGRLPPLPALHHATHLTIEHPWQAHFVAEPAGFRGLPWVFDGSPAGCHVVRAEGSERQTRMATFCRSIGRKCRVHCHFGVELIDDLSGGCCRTGRLQASAAAHDRCA